MPFCTLLQRPAIAGPASVWVMAQWLEAKAPYPTHAVASTANDGAGELRGIKASASRLDATARPPTTAARRTRVGEWPAAISRSVAHPAASVDAAISRNTAEVSRDIAPIGIFSSSERYAGSHASRK